MQLTFNAQSVPPSQPFEPMPAGWYPAKLTGAEPTPTKDNATTGNWYLKCEYTIIGGNYVNRKVWNNLNLQNQNQEAVRIAYEQLSAVCHAAGKLVINDTSELFGIPIMIKLSLTSGNDGYEPRNEVKGWKPYEETGGSGGPQLGGGNPQAGGGPQMGFNQQQPQQQPQQPQQQMNPSMGNGGGNPQAGFNQQGGQAGFNMNQNSGQDHQGQPQQPQQPQFAQQNQPQFNNGGQQFNQQQPQATQQVANGPAGADGKAPWEQ